MSSLLASYKRITFNNGTKTLAEKAAKLGALHRMLNIWTIPLNSSVYISATTPPLSAGRGALIGRSIESITSSGFKYRVWHGATDIVYDGSPNPTFVTPGSQTVWRKLSSVNTGAATIVDEFWLPDGSNVGGGSGSFEEVEEIRYQPNDTEIVIQIHNLSSVQALQVLLQLTYIEDPDNLILHPGGT